MKTNKIIILFIILLVSVGCGNNTDKNTKSKIDIDLLNVSSTIAYSEVYNITNKPDDYLGKTVRLSGTLDCFHYDETDKDYFNCLINDATACCSVSLEFVVDDSEKQVLFDHDGESIVVMGVFNTYMENGLLYGTLENAQFEFVE